MLCEQDTVPLCINSTFKCDTQHTIKQSLSYYVKLFLQLIAMPCHEMYGEWK